MIIFKDLVSEDELFSDTFKLETDDVFYKVKGKLTTEKDEVSDSMFGGNASAEDAAESYETEGVSGINVVLAHKLVETSFTKKDYMRYIKNYMKQVKTKMEETKTEEQVTAFTKNVTPVVKSILASFDNKDKENPPYDHFFLGESMNDEGMVVLCRYEDDDKGEEHPYLYFFKDGLIEEKV